MKKVGIIGAGIGGIAAALRLQLQGAQVDVFEQAGGPGGKLHQFHLGAYRFDAGPSLFTLPHLVEELLDMSEVPREAFPYIRLEQSCHYFWNDGVRFKAWADRERFAQEVENTFGVDSKPVLKHLEQSAFLFDKTASLFMERSLHKLKSYLSKDVVKALFSIHRLQLLNTMHEGNEKALNHPKLVQLFNRYATYNGSDPYRAPGVLHIIPHLEHNIGTFFPRQGMFQITSTLEGIAKEKGVRFHYNTAVDSIDYTGNQVEGITVGGKKLPFDTLVSNADVFTTYRKLMPEFKAPEHILRRERSSSALIFYWGVKRSFPELDLHNIFFADDYKAEFDAIKAGASLYNDPTVYVNITSKYQANDAPEGCENWFVMINVPANSGQDWERWTAAARTVIQSKLNRILNIDLSQLIEEEQILDPILIEEKTSSHMGALYGTSSNDRLAAFLRHPNFSSRLKGLYFCGGSVHPGGGIPLCLLSARITTELMTNELG